ncbi:D-alanine transaminase [Mycoplana sp. BE70]|uniref:D-amino-acid transaminase n=1 Tax=Mycoplana sp. BE70 TaxID=2817775 RepID=UPI002862A1E1|nr:D-amino-acid transaminase [Mycoplana sp. BE70]MDR6759192.1 D-alanine transaminase [Mycoplana sp. BE70]
MSRIIYVNGKYVPEQDASVSVFDRGLLFGDSIYEVTAVIEGRMIDNDLHLSRLQRSLAELGIPMPASIEGIAEIQNALITHNKLEEGLIYLQVTRGVADRNFDYDDASKPTLLGFTQAKDLRGAPAIRNGIRVAVVEDRRWARRDIKTTMLLPQVQAKREAKNQGCTEAWMVEDGFVTEGASSTAYIVTADGRIVTRPNSHATLPGCTRRALLSVAETLGLTVDEARFTIDDALAAREAFLTSASSLVTPVIEIGGRSIGDGAPGPVTRLLQATYLELAQRT